MPMSLHILCSGLLCTLFFGCGPTTTPSLERSLQEYNSQQWLLCEMWATKSIDEHDRVDESQYMMGLCEFKLNKFESAKNWFDEAALSSNPDVRGKAIAMLGIIASNRGDYITAVSSFNAAALDLEGKDLQEATSRATHPAARNLQRPTSQLFTLQFGAYLNQANATNAVAALTQPLSRSHLGKAWIIEETDRFGRTMFLVHAGHFSSRNEAMSRQNRGDLPQCMVTARR